MNEITKIYDRTFDDIEDCVAEDNLRDAALKLVDFCKDFVSDNNKSRHIAVDLLRQIGDSERSIADNIDREKRSIERSRISKAILGLSSEVKFRVETKGIPHVKGIDNRGIEEVLAEQVANVQSETRRKDQNSTLNLASAAEKRRFLRSRAVIDKASHEPLIELTDVTFQHPNNDQPTLDGVNFHLEDREIVCLIGENGAGKSTLLNLLSGTLKADSGQITFSPLLSTISGLTRRLNICSLGAERNTWSGTVYQYLTLLSLATNGNNEIAYLAVREVIERYRLHDVLSKKSGQMSTGQSLRVDIARATLTKPRVFILDEPFANLSPPGRRELTGYLLDITSSVASPTSVVLTSHIHSEIDSVFDRLLYLDIEKKRFVDLPNEPGSLLRIRFCNPVNLEACRGFIIHLTEGLGLTPKSSISYMLEHNALMVRSDISTQRIDVWSAAIQIFGNDLSAIEDLSETRVFWESAVDVRWERL